MADNRVYHGEPGEQSTAEGKALLAATPLPPDTSEPEPPAVYHGEPGELRVTKVPDITPPATAKLVETSAKGEPAVYQEGKTRYYAPGSTMYQMGFRTSGEYRRSQLRGTPYGIHEGSEVPENTIVILNKRGEPYMRVTPEQMASPGFQSAYARQLKGSRYLYPVRNYEGREVLLLPYEVDKIYNASNRQQFNYLVRTGVLPERTEYVPPEREGEPWEYILPQAEQNRELPEVKIPAPTQVTLAQRPQEKTKVFAMGPHLERIAVSAGLSPKLAGVVPAAGAAAAIEPTPIGEVLLYGGIAAVVIAAGSQVDWPEVKKQVQAAIADYKANVGNDPRYQDILIVDGTAGKVLPLAEVVEMAKPNASLEELTRTRPDIQPVEVQKWEPHAVKPIEIQSGEQLIPPEVAAETMMVTKGVGPREIANVLEQPIPGTNVKWQEPVIVLPGTSQAYPKRLIQDTATLMERAGMMVATARVATQTLPLTRRQWEEIEESMRRADIDRAVQQMVDEFNRLQAQKKISADVGRHYRAAYEEYLKRRAAYEAARKAYIESLNPKAVGGGRLSDDALNAYATYTFNKTLNLTGGDGRGNLDNATLSTVGNHIKRINENATLAAIEAATKAANQNLSESDTGTLIKQAAEDAVKDYTKTIPNEAIKEAVETATETIVDNAIDTTTQTITETETETETTATPTTATTTPTTTTPATPTTTTPTITTDITTDVPPPPPPPPPPYLRSDEEQPIRLKDWRSEYTPSAIAWKQGGLKGKHGVEGFYYVVKEPYESEDDVFTFKASELPPGVKPMPLAKARESFQKLGKRIPSSLKIDLGIVDVKAGKNLEYRGDPKQQTKGDITIGGVTIREVKPTIVGGRERTNTKRRNTGIVRTPRTKDLGMGIVQEGRRRHLRLV